MLALRVDVFWAVSATQKPVVLIVDDKPANLLALEAVLDSTEGEIVRAQSGNDALRHLLALGDRVAVILLDVQMPGIDGFETAQLIRRRESLKLVPIIFVTAVGREEAHILKGYANGAVDYLVKPFNEESLRVKVKQFVDLHRKRLDLEREHRDSEQRLSLALAAAELGTWSWTASTGEVVCDQRCRALLDALPTDALTLSSFEVDVGTLGLLDDRIRTELRSASGRWLVARGRAYRDEDGRVARILGVLHDITEQKHAERERELFLGALGHDLRNPLNAITMATHLLAAKDDPHTTGLAMKIANSARRMSNLIGDLLDFVRNRSGELPVEPQHTDLNAICRTIIAEIEQAHPSSRIQFSAAEAANGVWDPGRLAQVVQNLVTNAVRHGDPREPVTVRVEARADEVMLQVENAGPTIPDDMKARIFEPFVSSAGGVGLGLYVANQLVRAHRGRIELISANARTVFTAVLPRSALQPSTGAAAIAPR